MDAPPAASSASDSLSFPIVTRRASSVISGYPTEVVLQSFSDRVLCLVSQGKIGRMLQISAPSSRALPRDPFSDPDPDHEADPASSAGGAQLPAPSASSNLTVLFGSSKSEELDAVEQMYAHHLAAILFTAPAYQQEGEGRAVVIGLGLKPAFLSEGEREGEGEGRSRFGEVMRLVGQASRADPISAYVR